ncbi:hypothetical protein SEA_FIZZLES_1 [Microbacterium phage Fizzles]|nr:hypothetical protein SEA_FIZZLES_1 [Microbacterium phage Fizzles]
MSKRVRLVALDKFDNERGAIDGERLTIWATDDGEVQVSNGAYGLLGGEIVFDWSDLVPDFERGEEVRLELEIVDEEEQPSSPAVDGVYMTDLLRDSEPFGERIDD